MINKKTTMLMTAGALALGGSNEASATSDVPVEAAIRAFVEAGDQRAVEAVKAATHERFRVAFVMGEAEDVTLLGRDDYLGLLAAKKIGGDDRAVHVLGVEKAGGLAIARVRLEGRKAVFEGSMTLIRDGEDWKVFQDAVHMRARK
ncbi:MAG: nuclear transport factor 2 family protein [Myxococcota bacterium]